MESCPNCGKDYKRLYLHLPSCAAPPVQGGTVEPRSERGRRRRGTEQLTPIQEIRWQPPGVRGPWAYYLRPDGATIRDALILYPNGAQLPPSEDEKGRYSENAEYYQRRQARKGFVYLGPTLTPQGVKLLLETLAKNREDEIIDLEDQIVECQHVIENSDRPDVRDNQRKRKRQLQERLDRVSRKLDAEVLSAELTEIARAQRLSRVDPKVLEVMREMVGEVNDKLMRAIAEASRRGRSPVPVGMGEDPSVHEGIGHIE